MVKGVQVQLTTDNVQASHPKSRWRGGLSGREVGRPDSPTSVDRRNVILAGRTRLGEKPADKTVRDGVGFLGAYE